MKKIIKYFLLAGLCMCSVACSKSRLEQLALAEGVEVKCTPEVLEAVAGKIPVSVTVTYPDGYFDKNAKIAVTPVLVYEGGEAKGPVFTYQGEKVKENNKVIPETGSTVSETFSFDFKEGMEKASLELRAVVTYKKESVEAPAKKIADGTITTYQLVDTKGTLTYRADNYQAVIRQSVEGQIMYSVNSATVKNSELKNASIKALQETLAEKKADERIAVTGTKIVAYASPEGGESLNAKLSDKRAESAKKAWKKIDKDLAAGETEIQSVGQDWEGFKDAVANSNLEDKNLILRVLSMYSDPAVRESEIRNMSKVFTELKDEVFPDLRRARFVTDMDYTNYTEEELKEISAKALSSLDEAAVLRLGTIAENPADKAVYYKYAADHFNSQAGLYNLAVANLEMGKDDAAAQALAKLDAQKDADVLNAYGVIALRAGKTTEAAEYFKAAGTKDASANAGVIDILNGNYQKAEQELAGAGNSNEALAKVLVGKYDEAKAIAGTDAVSEYVKAVASARQGKVAEARACRDKACAESGELKARATKDIEFATVK